MFEPNFGNFQNEAVTPESQNVDDAFGAFDESPFGAKPQVRKRSKHISIHVLSPIDMKRVYCFLMFEGPTAESQTLVKPHLKFFSSSSDPFYLTCIEVA